LRGGDESREKITNKSSFSLLKILSLISKLIKIQFFKNLMKSKTVFIHSGKICKKRFQKQNNKNY